MYYRKPSIYTLAYHLHRKSLNACSSVDFHHEWLGITLARGRRRYIKNAKVIIIIEINDVMELLGLLFQIPTAKLLEYTVNSHIMLGEGEFSLLIL